MQRASIWQDDEPPVKKAPSRNPFACMGACFRRKPRPPPSEPVVPLPPTPAPVTPTPVPAPAPAQPPTPPLVLLSCCLFLLASVLLHSVVALLCGWFFSHDLRPGVVISSGGGGDGGGGGEMTMAAMAMAIARSEPSRPKRHATASLLLD